MTIPPGLPKPDAYLEARMAVRQGITRAVKAIDPDAFITRPMLHGAHSTELVPKPSTGLQAALILREAAAQAVDRQICEARGSGLSWRELAEILGADTAEDAYRQALGPAPRGLYRDDRKLFWHCWTCEGGIADNGPYNGVENDERGHAEGCARHAADIAAEKARPVEQCGDDQ